jgi:hypothetical protein
VLAPRLADVLVGHPDPLVPVGLEQHLLDQLAVLLLDVSAVAESLAGLPHPFCELVAELLELNERQDPRASAGGNLPLESLAGPGRAKELGELLLQARHLLEQ